MGYPAREARVALRCGNVQTLETFASIHRLSQSQIGPHKGNHSMNDTSKTTLIIAFAAIALLLLLFGGGMMTGTVMTGGMMGSGSMGGISWMWVPTLLVVVLGFALISAISGKK